MSAKSSHRYITLVLLCCLVVLVQAPLSLAAPDGEYNVRLEGTDFDFSGNPSARQVVTKATIKVISYGQTVNFEVSRIGAMLPATVYKGRWNSESGDFCGIWWQGNAQQESKILFGVQRGNEISGFLVFPRVSDRLLPGYLKLQFSGTRKESLQEPPLVPIKPFNSIPVVDKEDCIDFNPDRLQLHKSDGKWKLLEDGKEVIILSANKDEAVRALDIIRNYNMDRMCYVRRPNPSFTYFLSRGKSPAGSFFLEDCVSFSPFKLEVKKVDQDWKIVEGDHWLLDFEQSESDARRALQVIRMHGFQRHCFVGAPRPSFEYWRK